jgi:hypothetical protein
MALSLWLIDLDQDGIALEPGLMSLHRKATIHIHAGEFGGRERCQQFIQLCIYSLL